MPNVSLKTNFKDGDKLYAKELNNNFETIKEAFKDGRLVITPTLDIGEVQKADEPSASITGDSPNFLLNLDLPKGDKGEQGEKGDVGEPGRSGVYIGKEEPQDPTVNVWIDSDGESDMSKYVKFTDVASETKAGVVKMWTSTNEEGEIGLNISTEV